MWEIQQKFIDREKSDHSSFHGEEQSLQDRTCRQ